jgi:outer membrane immunogenic protein
MIEGTDSPVPFSYGEKYMKRLLAVAALLATTALSSAADFPTKAPFSPAPAYVDPWAGFYAGLDVGYAGSRVTDNTNAVSFSPVGGMGGAYAGYNWHTGLLVAGLEGDVGYIGLTQNLQNLTLNSGWYGDVTGRLGVTFGPVMMYGKGGYAYYQGAAGVTGTSVASGGWNGWTAGGGIEYALAKNVLLRAEYLHFDFGTLTVSPVNFTTGLTMDTVKAGIAYRF